jgi:outer membrane receptor for ferrienterochelin and colicin
MREFEVITSGGIAEFGRASGGVVNIVTQSGTNDYRGRVYGFLRNQRLDARNPLAPTKDPFTQAQYGASFGGPLKRDRTFFFSNFEQTRLNNARPSSPSRPPRSRPSTRVSTR